MGIVAFSDDVDVPFSRRLFSALASFAKAHGADRVVWTAIENRFEYSGCFLNVEELDEIELNEFAEGIDILLSHVASVDTFAGFNGAEVVETLHLMKRYLNH